MNDLIEPLFTDPLGGEYEEAGADDVRKALCMSPSQFVEMLSGKNGPRLVTSSEDSYLLYCGDRNFFTTDEIEGLSIHRLDLQEYLNARQTAAAPTPDTSTLNAQLAEVQAERDRLSEALEAANTHIAEIEAANPTDDKALQERDAQIAVLQSEIKTVRGIINQCGALSVVVKMLEGGSTKEDIATFLKAGGLSNSQVGVLLHADPLHVGGDAIAMCAKRLLGIAAK